MKKIRLRAGDWSGEAIKERRLKLNLTQKELAKKIGCIPGTISNYEVNTFHPAPAALGRLIAILVAGVNDASNLYRSNFTSNLYRSNFKRPGSIEHLLTKQDVFRIVKKHISTGEKP